MDCLKAEIGSYNTGFLTQESVLHSRAGWQGLSSRENRLSNVIAIYLPAGPGSMPNKSGRL